MLPVFFLPTAELALDQDKEHRHEEDGEEGGGEHAADDADADGVLAS